MEELGAGGSMFRQVRDGRFFMYVITRKFNKISSFFYRVDDGAVIKM